MYKTNNFDSIIIRLIYFLALLLFLIFLTEKVYIIFIYSLISLVFVFYLLTIFKKIVINEEHVSINGVFKNQNISKEDIKITLFNPKGILTSHTHIRFEVKVISKNQVIGFMKFDKMMKARRFEQFLKENKYCYSSNRFNNSSYY
jgi:hypothetical protein